MTAHTLPDGIYLNADRVLGEADLRFVKHNRWRTVHAPDIDYTRHATPLPAHAAEWVRLADLPALTNQETP